MSSVSEKFVNFSADVSEGIGNFFGGTAGEVAGSAAEETAKGVARGLSAIFTVMASVPALFIDFTMTALKEHLPAIILVLGFVILLYVIFVYFTHKAGIYKMLPATLAKVIPGGG